MFISLTSHLGSFSTICSLFPRSPRTCVTFPQTRTEAARTHKLCQLAHWVIFRIQEGHCLLCTMDTCQGLVAVNLTGLDSRLPLCSEKCKHGNGLVYFFGLFFKKNFFKCTVEVCRGSNQTTVIF